MQRVLLVNMPFASLRWPALGTSLLAAALARQDIDCDVAYLNCDFAERIGLENYNWLADEFGFVLGGERLFAQDYFPGRLPNDEHYYREVLLQADPGLTAGERWDYEGFQEHVAPFLDHCEQSIDWSRYGIVGFACSFQQTMASVCLAARIKQRRPGVKIVLGGAACEGPMGIELLRQFTPIDYVFLGEADASLPCVARQILAGKAVRLPPGVVGRQRERTLSPSSALQHGDDGCEAGAGDLDQLPYPDFDAYFARLRQSTLAAQVDPLLFFETSRGCWWGQKQRCAFCGLNGSRLTYRSKSPQRAVDELRWLCRRYDLRRACSADNIFDHHYFQSFLPLLRQSGIGLSFEFEMRTSVTRQQVESLIDAGLGAAQLGIETFSTPILKLMCKGVTALQNLQALKWFSNWPIEIKWNLLYGFPREDPGEYAKLADLLPSLVHLAPPLAVGQVRMDRFAPYFEDPVAFGLIHPRPHRAFAHVYPFPTESLARLAYYFEYDYADGRRPLDYAQPVVDAARAWQQLKGAVTFRAFDREDGLLLLTDNRPCAAAFQRRLSGLKRKLYLFCDAGRTFEQIVEHTAESGEARVPNTAAIRALLDSWVSSRLAANVDDRYLSLATAVRE